MRIVIRRFLLFALFLIALSLPSEAMVMQMQRPKILLVGDSHADFCIWMYPRIASSGATAEFIQQNLVNHIPEDDYDIIVVMAGSNNLVRGDTEEQMWDHVDDLVDAINVKCPSSNIVVISPYKIGAISQAGYCLSDGHLNEEGYSILWDDCMLDNLTLKAAQ